MRCRSGLIILATLHCVLASAAPPKDPGLEQAKRAFEQKMKQIDEEATKEREKTTAKLREEYKDLISKKQKAGDNEAVAYYTKEAKELLGEDGAKGVEGFKKLRKGMPLAQFQPVRFQGQVSFMQEWDKIVPSVEGRLTTEPFLWSPANTTSEWLIPKGAKTFEAYGHVIRPYAHDSQDCILEVRIDGKPAAKSMPLSNNNRTHKFVVEIPKGAKTITLYTDANKGGTDNDLAAWVEPYFYDR